MAGAIMCMSEVEQMPHIILETENGTVVGDVVSMSCTHDGPFSMPRFKVEFYADESKNRNRGISPMIFDAMNNIHSSVKKSPCLKASKVIFNPPATVVLWEDGTKTVVKCDKDDTFDEMKGLALCYMKKALGNTSRELNRALRSWQYVRVEDENVKG